MSTYQKQLDQLRFITGQDNLSDADGTRLMDFAIDDYSTIAMSADGRWKFDDSSQTDHPKGYGPLVASQHDYQLDVNFLQVDQVHVKVEGKWRVLEPIDSRDYQSIPADQVHSTAGTPKYFDYDGESVFLYPAPSWSDSGDLTDTDNLSLRVRHTRPGNYVSDLSDSLGIPRNHGTYLWLHCARQLGYRTIDSNRVDIRDELTKWEGIQGKGGYIREFYTSRDESRSRKFRPKVENAFSRRIRN